MKICLTEVMDMLKPYNIKTRPIITDYCRKGLIPAVFENDRWLIDKDYVEKAMAWRDNELSLDELINNIVVKTTVQYDKWEKNKRNLSYHLRDIKTIKNKYSILFAEKIIDKNDLNKAEQIISKELNKVKKQNELISVKDASIRMNLSIYQAKKLIRQGYLNAELVNDNWFVNESEIDGFIKKRDEYIGIYTLAADIVKNKSVVWKLENRIDRAMLNNYIRSCELSKYIKTAEELNLHDDRRNSLFIPAIYKDKAIEIIDLYISSYGHQEELLQTLKQSEYFMTHPINQNILIEFEPQKTLPGMVALYDTIINSCEKEILDCNDEDVLKMMQYCNKQKKKIYKTYLSRFIKYCKENYNCQYSLDIKTSSDVAGVINTLPYKQEQYFAFAYMIFNENYIKNNSLVEKAIASPKCAFLWLYTAWHYIAAWRKIDICNMPIIPLLSSYEDAIEKIKLGLYDDEAVKAADLLEHYINNLYIPPSKTKNRQKERFLVVSLRTSLRKVIGIAYTLFCYHFSELKKPEGNFKINDYLEFFGDRYVRIFGMKPFSNRRANKSFLGEVATITEKKQGVDNKVLGYRVASYARAHIENDMGISTVTSKYLTTKLDGLSKDEILFELFEAGFCSFVPYYLLEIVYGESFSKLSVGDQTQIIKKWGVSANMTEEIVIYLEDCYKKADLSINQFFRNCGTEKKRELAEEMLESIINRKAIGKDKGVSCLPAARKLPCLNMKRDCCLGCKYAINEKTYFWKALNVVNEAYLRIKHAKTEGEKNKYQLMLNKEYLVGLTEMLEIAKSKYGIEVDSYQHLLGDIIKKRGIEKNE